MARARGDVECKTLLETVVVKHRWLLVCLFVLPASLLFNIFLHCRSWLIFRLKSAPSQHGRKVARVQQQLEAWRRSGANSQLCTARPGWQNMSFRRAKYKQTMHTIDLGDLLDVLKVDANNMTVDVEPMVTMGQLTSTLLPLGWTIPVVPELDDLTVGGLVMGTGVESSSHVHGLFHETCLSYELVTADGRVVSCSKDENADLFHSIPWSHGTLGFLTSVRIRLVKAAKFVRLTYASATTTAEAVRKFAQESANPGNDFVEGILYSEREAVIMRGKLTDHCLPDKVNPINRWYKPWFFAHARKALAAQGEVVEYVPLKDYYHRHTRSLFWEMQDIVPFGNNALFRALLGWLLPPKVSLLKLTQTEGTKRLYENNHIIQDMLVPMASLAQSLDLFDAEVKVYPIWLCPFKLSPSPGMLKRAKTDAMYVDVGVYGVPQVPNFSPRETTRRLEAFVRSVGGYQMLYADSYMTRDEFRDMFYHQLYFQVRQKYGSSSAFPEVYDKICKAARD